MHYIYIYILFKILNFLFVGKEKKVPNGNTRHKLQQFILWWGEFHWKRKTDKKKKREKKERILYNVI